MLTTIIILFIIGFLISIIIYRFVKSKRTSQYIPRDERIYFNKFHEWHKNNKITGKENSQTHIRND